jgi:hypothetical protein
MARSLILTLISALGALGSAQPAFAEEENVLHRCINDDGGVESDGARLIEVLFSNLQAGQACKVIYRPESESDKLGTVAWQDLASADLCRARADEVIGQLLKDGWTCTLTREEGTTVAQAFPEHAELDQEASFGSFDDVEKRTSLSVYPDLEQPSDELLTLIDADLNNLGAKLDGSLHGMVAGYGDLNDDGVDEVLVLFSYQSPKPAYRQFIVAYMHDGEAFRLTSTKPIGGYASGMIDARVDAVDRGVVHLTLQSFEPGDASCCPSGQRPLALMLRDLDFVEVDAGTPTR